MLEITKTNEWNMMVEKQSRPIVCCFYAPKSYACNYFLPEYQFVASDENAVYNQKAEFILVDVSKPDGQEIAKIYGVVSLPTVVMVKNAKPVTSMMGFVPREVLANCIGGIL